MSVLATTEDQLKGLMRLYEKEDFDFWGSPSINETTNVLVTSEQRTKFNKFLDRFSLRGQVVIDDVYRYEKNSLSPYN